MKTLSIDIETYSDQNLAKCGVYRYVESSVFEILLFSYSVDGGAVQLVDLACGEKIPADIIAALEDDAVTKWAFNANFERICLSRHLGYPTGDYLEPGSWKCSMVWAATMGLPLSLEGVGAVLGLEKQKLTEGKELIKYFCQPCAPTKANGKRTRNLPAHAPDKWLAFKKYNIRDVEAEMSIQTRLAKYPVPDSVWDEYHLDQEINDRGVALDMELVRQAIQMDSRSRAELTQAMKELTELENPNSVQQMKLWLADNGMETDTLGKKAVAEMLKTASPQLQTVLSLRQQLAKSSVKKYQAMETAVCADGRARGMFQFYGANRTGRWAGRIIQMQNLPQNHLEDLAEARGLVRCGDFDALEMLYEDVPDTLSQLIRTAFVPQDNCKFIVADFSAIEARVIAWLAGEEWRQKVFADGKDIYCASASQMFGVPVEKHGINGHLRQKGKIAELALGYGGSVGALKAMGALEMGLAEEELQPLVQAWRDANPNITKLWWDVDRAAMDAVRYRYETETHGITFTGTSTKHREGFKRMVADALAGKIDLIVTKSVSRFARNTVDSLTTVRKLKEKGVEIYFEKENIWTLDSKGELLITIMSSLAQEESRSISENCTWGQRKRFADGKVTVPFAHFLGYDRGPDGNLVLNEKEAVIVRRIYGMFLQGMSPYGIATRLTAEGILSPGGKSKWNAGAVRSILTNEKYKGDALLQKSYTVDFLTKKKKVNEGEIPQYYVEGNHEAIIQPEVYEMVQRELEQRKNSRGRHSGVHLFSGRIKCGHCGGWYGSKTWHSNDKYRRVIWQCNHKFEGEQKCTSPHFYEDEIKLLFVTAVNKLISQKDAIIAQFNLALQTAFDTSALARERDDLQAELLVVSELMQNSIYENAHVALDQEEYQKRYDGLTARFDKAKARLEMVEAAITDKQSRQATIEAYLETLKTQDTLVEKFESALWCGLLDFVTVYGKDDVRFTFKDGTEIKA